MEKPGLMLLGLSKSQIQEIRDLVERSNIPVIDAILCLGSGADAALVAGVILTTSDGLGVAMLPREAHIPILPPQIYCEVPVDETIRNGATFRPPGNDRGYNSFARIFAREGITAHRGPLRYAIRIGRAFQCRNT